MRRSSLVRSIAALLAAWSLVVEVGPASLHTCPMHDQGLRIHAPGSASVHTRATAGHAAHGAKATVLPGSTRDGNGGSHSRCCTCVGPCCGVAPVALAARGELLAGATIVAIATAVIQSATF